VPAEGTNISDISTTGTYNGPTGLVLVPSVGMATGLRNFPYIATNNALMLKVYFYIQFVVTPTYLI